MTDITTNRHHHKSTHSGITDFAKEYLWLDTISSFKDSKSLADIRNIKDRWILKLLDCRPIIMEVLHQTISWRYFYLHYNKIKKRQLEFVQLNYMCLLIHPFHLGYECLMNRPFNQVLSGCSIHDINFLHI